MMKLKRGKEKTHQMPGYLSDNMWLYRYCMYCINTDKYYNYIYIYIYIHCVYIYIHCIYIHCIYIYMYSY